MKTEYVYMLVVLMLAVFAGTSVYAAGKATVEKSSSVAILNGKINLTCKVEGGDADYKSYTWSGSPANMLNSTTKKTVEATSRTKAKGEIKCSATKGNGEKTKESSATNIWFTDMTVTMKGKTEAKVNETVQIACSAENGEGPNYTYKWAVDTLGVGIQIGDKKYNVSSNKAINVNVMCIANDTKGAVVGKLHTIRFKGAPASELGEKPSATEKENSSVTFKLGLGISLPLVMAAVSALKLW